MKDQKNDEEPSAQLLGAALAKAVESSEGSEKKIGVIFQCKLPPRKFSVKKSSGKPRTTLQGVLWKTDRGSRKATFDQFVKDIKDIIGGEEINAFVTSGSVAAKVTVHQLKEIMRLVGNIKGIRANRRF